MIDPGCVPGSFEASPVEALRVDLRSEVEGGHMGGWRDIARHSASVLAVAVGYYASAVIGTVLSVPPSGFAIIWPATAFVISVLLVAPARLWWLYLSVVILAHFHLATIFQPGAPSVVVLTQIGGNIALAISTVLAVQYATRKPALFDTFRSVVIFVIVAGVAVPAVVNALILSLHLASGWTSNLPQAWRQWMIAGIFPTITIPPVLVLAIKGG
jgi:integral membrane sensor domain MASE1